MQTQKEENMLNDKRILITGGTGSLGNALVEKFCAEYHPDKLIIFSRDEFKQSLMQKKYDYDCLRYFIGDVRDLRRLKQACNNVDIVIHAAALKQIPAIEYNPTEAVRTNIDGTVNVIEACIENNIKKAVFISTDKACSPINLYGATKLCAEKLWLAANSFNKTLFSVVRYGNVINSRGSVIEHFLKLKAEGIKEFPITDRRMTRFWITLEEAVKLVIGTLDMNWSKYPCIPHIPSMKITELAKAIEPDCTFKEIGIRPGEKLHEVLAAKNEQVHYGYGWSGHQSNDTYTSDTNDQWMTKEELREKLGITS